MAFNRHLEREEMVFRITDIVIQSRSIHKKIEELGAFRDSSLKPLDVHAIRISDLIMLTSCLLGPPNVCFSGLVPAIRVTSAYILQEEYMCQEMWFLMKRAFLFSLILSMGSKIHFRKLKHISCHSDTSHSSSTPGASSASPSSSSLLDSGKHQSLSGNIPGDRDKDFHYKSYSSMFQDFLSISIICGRTGIDSRVEVWVMKEYGVERSWTKQYCILNSTVFYLNQMFEYIGVPIDVNEPSWSTDDLLLVSICLQL
ncbi:LOW QUALITY PROTEIN: hypothetical protein PanWU01x14_193620 [Parasponia andersonii]|uniref:F-box associated domain-containing protein n=1 Tax=Parasponia andersonii TaxID=3476 RepID=A0A2P5C0S2_PARAD|nr:LOW QUALITY PROTEIN: hypothetical protein PanWU01x14_193620 [Parasponia andersonii]